MTLIQAMAKAAWEHCDPCEGSRWDDLGESTKADKIKEMRAALQAAVDFPATVCMERGAAHTLADLVEDIDQKWSDCKKTATKISKSYLRAALNEHDAALADDASER